MTDQSAQEVGHKSSLPVGKILASARSEQGMTTDMVAARLCLTESYIKALEAGKYETLPGDTFIRGYLRNYADIVGLNGEELVRVYIEQQHLAKEAEALEASQRQKSSGTNKLPIFGIAIVILVVIAVVIGLGIEEPEDGQAVNSPAAVDATVESVSETDEVISDTDPSVTMDSDKSSVNTSETQDDLSATSTADENESSESSANAVQSEENEAALHSVNEEVSDDSQTEEQDTVIKTEMLFFTFSGDCWYQVVDSTGAKLAERTKSAGDTSNIEGVPPFTITLGDTTAVELIYQGELVDLTPYYDRKSARFKVGD